METGKMQPLFSSVKILSENNGDHYRDRVKDRDELLAFMDANDWFHSSHTEEAGEVMVSLSEEMQEALKIWVHAYRKSDREKAAFMMEILENRFPDTGRSFREFSNNTEVCSERCTWKVLDFMLADLKKELKDYSDTEINQLVESAYRELKMKELSLLSSYLSYDAAGAAYTDWKYRFSSHQIIKTDNSAYGISEFALMAYIVLNPESWKDNRLVEKALDNQKHANLWLFSALHFICALRATDILRLPVPDLPYEPEVMRMMVREGRFFDPEAYDLAYELQYRCRMGGKRPHKTLKKGISPEIKLFIPESLLVPLGLIMAISLSFRKQGDLFVPIDYTLADITRFFGEDFAEAAGYRKFKSRRANKSYIQGIESIPDDLPGKPKGYMLASLARSHKGGIGKLAEITDVYLRDAKFTGEDPGFVLKEMFERGVFGFIPCMLLDMYHGEAFRSLGISDQTEVIKNLGMEAWQIEAVAQAVAMSYRKAGMIVKSTLDEAGGEGCLAMTLRKIASGSAASKQEECMCLRRAAGLECTRPGASACLGCGYEVYTKTALQMLAREYVRLNRKAGDSEDGERVRAILKSYIIPSIMEILQSITVLYPDADMEIMKKIIERGMNDADAGRD